MTEPVKHGPAPAPIEIHEESPEQALMDPEALEGSAGDTGAGGMARISSETRSVGEGGDPARAPGLLREPENEFGRAKPAFEREAGNAR